MLENTNPIVLANKFARMLNEALYDIPITMAKIANLFLDEINSLKALSNDNEISRTIRIFGNAIKYAKSFTELHSIFSQYENFLQNFLIQHYTISSEKTTIGLENVYKPMISKKYVDIPMQRNTYYFDIADNQEYKDKLYIKLLDHDDRLFTECCNLSKSIPSRIAILSFSENCKPKDQNYAKLKDYFVNILNEKDSHNLQKPIKALQSTIEAMRQKNNKSGMNQLLDDLLEERKEKSSNTRLKYDQIINYLVNSGAKSKKLFNTELYSALGEFRKYKSEKEKIIKENDDTAKQKSKISKLKSQDFGLIDETSKLDKIAAFAKYTIRGKGRKQKNIKSL